jgi:hypothetical protein
VPYDAAFKAKDRFQLPMTRGVRGDSATVYDDAGVKQIVGVIAVVTYASEYEPAAEDGSSDDESATVAYTYDLELSDVDGVLVPTGGEWQNNTHPDFLWVPRKDSALQLAGAAAFRRDQVPPLALTAAAAAASEDATPLCSVLTELVRGSSGQTTAAVCQVSDAPTTLAL